jgi:hypothetical protein
VFKIDKGVKMKKERDLPKKKVLPILWLIVFLVFSIGGTTVPVAYADDQSQAKQLAGKAQLTLEEFGGAP